jgi:hypothetical protein
VWICLWKIFKEFARLMREQKSKKEILEDVDLEIEQCCINIFENLQANEITLTCEEILRSADEFYKKLDRQNNKVIVTGDGKYANF